MPDKDKIRKIRAQIDAHAPYPAKGEVSPVAMARHLAMTALTRRVRLDCMPVSDTGMPARYRETDALCADFAAAVAFWALADKGMGELDLGVSTPLVPEAIRGRTPVQVATMIRDIWESGELGEWLWEFLGKDVAEDVTALVTQLCMLTGESGDQAAPAAEAVSAK